MQTKRRQAGKSRRARQLFASFRRWAAYVVILGLSAVLLGFIAYLTVRVFAWQSAISAIHEAKDRISIENEILKNLFQMIGGALFLFGLYFTWRNLRLSQEGQITQRFNDAIEHLGSDKAEVRLGGIYALARIARDSPRDHMSVMQIFSLFVREKTSRQPTEPVTAEVQAILTMIAQRTLEYEGDGDVIDLSDAFLPGVNLVGAQLEGLRLVGTNLSRANLENALIAASDLRSAVLEGAYLRNADLRHTDALGSDFRNASLRGAKLDGADLAGAKLDGAVLLNTDLSGVKNATRQQIGAAITDETTVLPRYDDLIRT